ncbi:hypothetical protein GCM10016455_16860 [Aliiroseovarius zhejiangensis]|uniref:Uncharacterized protein n=1 Tax=Aliiroseovarius zhejiangensis TaxID=1632025 RepID=A0ABQ3J101_9RHOB|nr:hypothetical protein GCM10016455_16860 [Aliiroseovarius zhejiangensis]
MLCVARLCGLGGKTDGDQAAEQNKTYHYDLPWYEGDTDQPGIYVTFSYENA